MKSIDQKIEGREEKSPQGRGDKRGMRSGARGSDKGEKRVTESEGWQNVGGRVTKRSATYAQGHLCSLVHSLGQASATGTWLRSRVTQSHGEGRVTMTFARETQRQARQRPVGGEYNKYILGSVAHDSAKPDLTQTRHHASRPTNRSYHSAAPQGIHLAY